jgi:putative flippase GtrA
MLPHRYLPLTVDLASVAATPLSITMSYLCYKFFVFRTHGNYLREWLRCFVVYGTSMIPNLVALPILTKTLMHLPHLQRTAPYLAGALMTGFTAIYSYIGHKKFSFRA